MNSLEEAFDFLKKDPATDEEKTNQEELKALLSEDVRRRWKEIVTHKRQTKIEISGCCDCPLAKLDIQDMSRGEVCQHLRGGMNVNVGGQVLRDPHERCPLRDGFDVTLTLSKP